MATPEQLRAIHLQDQAQAFGCEVETYEGNNAVYLRYVPVDVLDDPAFGRFVVACYHHNAHACRTWKESE